MTSLVACGGSGGVAPVEADADDSPDGADGVSSTGDVDPLDETGLDVPMTDDVPGSGDSALEETDSDGEEPDVTLVDSDTQPSEDGELREDDVTELDVRDAESGIDGEVDDADVEGEDTNVADSTEDDATRDGSGDTDVLTDAIVVDADVSVDEDAGSDVGADVEVDGAADVTADVDTGPEVDAGVVLPATAVRVTLSGTTLTPGAVAAGAGSQRLFVSSRRELVVSNQSGTSAVLELTTPTQVDGRPEEWRLTRNTTDREDALTVFDLGPGESRALGLEFMPVQTGLRSGSLSISLSTSSGSVRNDYLLTGTGTDALLFAPQAEPTLTRAWWWGVASSGSNVQAGSLAVDESGNQYVTGTARRWSDAAAPNMVLGRIGEDGEADWLRELRAPFVQESPDPGQNGESGGAAGCIAVDDAHVWLVGRWATDAVDSAYMPVLLQVDRGTGELVRGIQLYPDGVRPMSFNSGAQAYAVDAGHPDRVFVVGTVQGQLQVLVWAVSKADGSLLWAYAMDPAAGTTDRGYGIAFDGTDGLYVSGLSGSRALLARLEGVTGASPQVKWAQTMSLGVGTNLPAVDTDAAGNAYLAVDVRGTGTQLRVMRIDRDGTHAWSRIFDRMDRTSLHNSHGVTVEGDAVYLSGRIGLSGYDRAQGDGVVVSASLDGEYRWGMMYYGGTTSDRAAAHRIKRVVVQGGQLHALAEIYAGGANLSAFDGYWYTVPDVTSGLPAGDGSTRWSEFVWTSALVTDLTASIPWERLTLATHQVVDSGLWQLPPVESTVVALDRATGPGNHTALGGFRLSSLP